MAEETEKEKQGKESGKQKKASGSMKYIGIISFAVLFSIFSFYLTGKVVLPRIYKAKVEEQLKSELNAELYGEDLGEGYVGELPSVETGGTFSDTGLTVADSIERGGSIFEKIFGKKKEGEEKEKEKEKKKRKGLGEIIKVTDITVNTNKSGGLRFVLVELAIEVYDKKVSQEIKDREPQIRDMFINYFRSKTAFEISKLDFQEKSKKELMEKLNNLLTEGEIDSIYYTKLILQ